MSRLIDDEGRATADLFVPTHPGEDHIGVSIPAGEVVPADLRAAVEALETPAPKPARRGKGG